MASKISKRFSYGKLAIYQFGGLRVASDFPLQGLHACEYEAEAQYKVVLHRATIPKDIAPTIATFSDGQYSGIYDGKEVLMGSSRVGRFLLRAGEEILIDLAPSSNPDEVRAYLLGAVFGALCCQRGITPLHASAIDVAHGHSVAFVGASGAGKSTLVAALARRGYQVISDDECFLQLGTNGDVRAWPGMSGIRLWQDARAALAVEVPRVKQSTLQHEKYILPICPPRNPSQSRSLRRVYQLHGVPKGVAEVTRLHGADAVEVLMQNVYPPGLAARLGYQARDFAVCTSFAREVPVFRFSRPWDLASLDEGIELLESHLRAMPRGFS